MGYPDNFDIRILGYPGALISKPLPLTKYSGTKKLEVSGFWMLKDLNCPTIQKS